MRSYGQFCPVAKASELFCERWTPLIIRSMASGAARFSELQGGVPLMSPTLLSRRLKQLEAEGIVERRKVESGKAWSYHLTQAGLEFLPLIEALGTWGQRWSRRTLQAHEIDLGLLLWGLERNRAPEGFGIPPTVVKLELTDQPEQKRDWWFLNRDGAFELCLKDPGYEVDLYLRSTLEEMIYIYRGDLPVHRALETERLEAHGPARMRKALGAWLTLGPIAAIASQRADAPRF